MPNYKSTAQARCLIVMGVSGCGKSTVGKQLAAKLGADFIDGDDLHPPENIEKMSNGLSLTDDDRAPWLARIQQRIDRSLAQQQSIVVVCSALKKAYRNTFRQHTRALSFVFLDGSVELIKCRMDAREGHFMKTDMLQSQFATLERPDDQEPDVMSIDIGQPVNDIISEVLTTLAATA